MLAILMVVSLTACGRESVGTPDGELENGVAAIEDAMTTKPSGNSSTPTEPIDDLRDGSSADTVATPNDFPAAYNYGSGKISDYSRTAMLQKMPEPAGNDTVLNTAADPANIQVLYLWEEGNVPARTKFTQDMTGYFDNYDFRPYVTAIPVRDGVKPKGAVVLMAGGAYQFRGKATPIRCPPPQHCGSWASRPSSWTIASLPIRRRKVRWMWREPFASSAKMRRSTALTRMILLSWAFRQAAFRPVNF